MHPSSEEAQGQDQGKPYTHSIANVDLQRTSAVV